MIRRIGPPVVQDAITGGWIVCDDTGEFIGCFPTEAEAWAAYQRDADLHDEATDWEWDATDLYYH